MLIHSLFLVCVLIFPYNFSEISNNSVSSAFNSTDLFAVSMPQITLPWGKDQKAQESLMDENYYKNETARLKKELESQKNVYEKKLIEQEKKLNRYNENVKKSEKISQAVGKESF